MTDGVNISPVGLLRIEAPGQDAFLPQPALQCGVPSFVYQSVASAYHTKHLYSKNIGYALRVIYSSAASPQWNAYNFVSMVIISNPIVS